MTTASTRANARKHIDSGKTLDKLTPYCSGRTLLDVGCGYGEFVYVANSSGWRAEGLEIDADRRASAGAKYGIFVHMGEITELSFNKRYALITLNSVIQYTANPLDILKKCYALLEDNGVLYLEAMNYDSPLYKYDSIPPDIKWHYNREAFNKTIDAAGFRIVKSWISGSSGGWSGKHGLFKNVIRKLYIWVLYLTGRSFLLSVICLKKRS
ncbi:MAG: class I SAM-dependent methyltransferase [Candidatus Omnitrophota bacterium]